MTTNFIHRSVFTLFLAAVLAPLLALTSVSSAGAVINGDQVTAAEQARDWPFIVRLEIDPTESGYGLCTGSVVAPRAVLTAAHCVLGASTVVVHFNTTSTSPEGPNRVTSTTFLVHEDYRQLIDANGDSKHVAGPDLALIYLAADAPVAPVALATDWPATGTNLQVGGFGKRGTANTSPQGQLHEGWLQVVDCPTGMRADTDLEVCMDSGPATGGDRTCSGDSGGPIVDRTPQGARLGAVVSRASNCGVAIHTLTVGVNRNWVNWNTTQPSGGVEAIVHGVRLDHDAVGARGDSGMRIDVTAAANHAHGRDLQIGVGVVDAYGNYVASSDRRYSDQRGQVRSVLPWSPPGKHVYTARPLEVFLPDSVWSSYGDHRVRVWIYDVQSGEFLTVVDGPRFRVVAPPQRCGAVSCFGLRKGGPTTGSIIAEDPVDRSPEDSPSGEIAFCEGEWATIVGTDGDDVLHGTDGVDVIHGLGGNDIIHGLDGNDVICGGSGRDRIFGGNGNDQLHGGDGGDIIRGHRGRDTIHGDRGNDRLVGGAGPDTLIGGGGRRDRLTGNNGSDRCADQQATTIRITCERR